MKTKVLFPSLFCITMFVAARAVLAGEPVHVISITENSPISLSVTYDGSSSGIMVDLTSSDHWAVTLPTTVNLSPLDVGAWREPENSMRLNEAFRAANSVDSFRMTVISDSSNFPEAIPVNDGAFVLMGTDTRDQAQVFAAFHDLAADVEAVPDLGSSFLLFALSLLGLLGAQRLCFSRPA